MQHCDSRLHVTGLSHYVDDVPPPAGMLHAAVFGSPVAHGKVRRLDLEAARAMDGVACVLTHDSIPGEPFIGPVRQDEPLLGKDEVLFHGQPLAVVVAETAALARKGAAVCSAEIDPLPVISCPREAYAAGFLLDEPRVYEMGDVDNAWAACEVVVEGEVDLGGQEHLYLETQRSRAIPREDGQVQVFASTQSPSAVQKHIARVLGLPMHRVEVDVRRLGGGFGGKEDQATHWACMAALAATRLNRPVQIVLNREEDLRMTGKRHPYKQDYRIGLDREGRILAFEVSHFQNSGAYMDLSAPVMERTVLHSTNAYAIPNVRIRTALCRTHQPPNTAFRGFGGPQGMFPLEAAIEHAAKEMFVSPDWIQGRNLVEDGYVFHYGQRLKNSHMRRTWEEAAAHFGLEERKRAVDAFNRAHRMEKKGLALMPVCFGISFTKTFLNQASSLVHVYTDGSINVTTGGVEMGQGVSSNMVAIVSRTFGVSTERVRCNSTNTARIANITPSAASATTDLNGNATLLACREIRRGLLEVAAKELGCAVEALSLADDRVHREGEPTSLGWNELVMKAYLSRAQLMAHGFYRSPDNAFDAEKWEGSPFHYYVFGTCLVEATVDCLRGRYRLDSARIVHDLGRTLIPTVDEGQVIGGLAQGIGWMTLEELAFRKDGRLASNALSTYKAPNVDSMPADIELKLLENVESPISPLGKKAVGEPPFMYGIAAFFALRRAMEAFRELPYGRMRAPLTPEQVLLQLYPEFEEESAGASPESAEERVGQVRA